MARTESSIDAATARRATLHVIVPLNVAFALIAVLGVISQRALGQGNCRLDLPWDLTTSEALLQGLFQAAWRDVEKLRTASSTCIAQLHTDISAAALIALLAAVTFTMLSFWRARLHLPRWFRPPPQGRPEMAIFLGVAAAGCIGWAAHSLTSGIFINFGPKYIKQTAAFDGKYISVLSYFIALVGPFIKMFLGALLAFWSAAFARLVWEDRGSGSKGGAST
jgi:uncharacterized membrane protein (GlpM family)